MRDYDWSMRDFDTFMRNYDWSLRDYDSAGAGIELIAGPFRVGNRSINDYARHKAV